MKLLKVTAWMFCICAMVSCSKDAIDQPEAFQINDAASQRIARGDGDMVVTSFEDILIEWEPGTTKNEKIALRNTYMSIHNDSDIPYYLVSWTTCSLSNAKEVWTVKHCGGCQPFHDPGDGDKIRSALYFSQCSN